MMTESAQQPPGPPAAPPPSPPYGQPPVGPGMPQPQNGMAVAALVLGICAILAAFALPPIGIVLGLLAIVFGVIGRNKAREDPAVGRAGMALAGLITGIAGAVIGLLVILIVGVLIGGAIKFTGDVMEEWEQIATEQEQRQREKRQERQDKGGEKRGR